MLVKKNPPVVYTHCKIYQIRAVQHISHCTHTHVRSIRYVQYSMLATARTYHRRRIYTEAKANSRHWEQMVAHSDCLADKLIKAGRASITVTHVLIKLIVT